MKKLLCLLLFTCILFVTACNSEEGKAEQKLPGGSVRRENGKPVPSEAQPVPRQQGLPGGSVRRENGQPVPSQAQPASATPQNLPGGSVRR